MRDRRNLFLVVTKHWYDEIACGRKRVEYRESTDYWRSRLVDEAYIAPDRLLEPARMKDFKSIEFQLGYSRKYPRLKFKIKSIDVVKTPEEVQSTVKTEYCFAIYFERLNIFDILKLKEECKT